MPGAFPERNRRPVVVLAVAIALVSLLSGAAGVSLVPTDHLRSEAGSTFVEPLRALTDRPLSSYALRVMAPEVYSGPGAPATTIAVGGLPWGEAYDPVNAKLFVVAAAANVENVSVIDTVTNRVISIIHLPEAYGDALYDPSDGLVYFGTCCSFVYAVNATTDQLVGTIQLGTGCIPGCSPEMEAYDPTTRDVYAVDWFTNNLTVINGLAVVGTISPPQCPTALGFDDLTGDLYESSNCNNGVVVINASSGRVVGNISSVQGGVAVVQDTANGEMFVAGNNYYGQVNVTVINGTTNQVVATIPMGNISGGAAYDPLTRDVYVTQNANFNYTPPYVWNVTVISGATNRIVGTLPSQRGPIGIAYDDFNHELYVADSMTWNVSLLFPLRSISFDESGLPTGTNWSVSMNNMSLWSNASTIPFSGADGPYSYIVPSIRNYTLSSNEGNFVVNGTNVTVDITFVPVRFSETFNETGLPHGVLWSVTLNGTTRSTSNASLSFLSKNGTYNFTVVPPVGYRVAPANGSLKIQGSNQTVSLVFTAIPKSSWTYLGLTAEEWEAIGVVAAIAVAVAIFAIFRSRKRKRTAETYLHPQSESAIEDRPLR